MSRKLLPLVVSAIIALSVVKVKAEALTPYSATARVSSEESIPVGPTAQIPHDRGATELKREYKTWSLFLICGPGWILNNGKPGISDLYQKFLAFGDAIGPDNVAVWFWKRQGSATPENTDLSRSSKYCTKYHLRSSNSPQILVTTQYPDDSGSGNYIVFKLNGLPAKYSASALDQLTDQITQTGLNQKNINEMQFWNSIMVASTETMSAVGCYFNKVSASIRIGFFNGELSHSGEGKC